MSIDVTIVITTFNEEKYLPILLNSIKNQKTKLKIEVIIVDDSSTDDTLNIAKSSGYKIINNENKSDVRYMRNLGLNVALGKTILFCDADVALSSNYIENMVGPIINGSVDTMLCKTYTILEVFYDIFPDNYSKSYVFFLKHSPKFLFRRFPVQLFPWLKAWFNNMKKEKKYLSIWTTPNRAHTTGIVTKTEISKSIGGWTVPIGLGDDAKYSLDVFSKSDKVLFDRKSVLYVSRRRVFPKDNSWIGMTLFGFIIKPYKKYIKKFDENNYSDSIR